MLSVTVSPSADLVPSQTTSLQESATQSVVPLLPSAAADGQLAPAPPVTVVVEMSDVIAADGPASKMRNSPSVLPPSFAVNRS
jgi:hypothetical protein